MKKIFSNCSSAGKLMIIIGLLMLIPMVVLPFYPNELIYASAFLIPAIMSIGLGMIVCLFLKPKKDKSEEWQIAVQYSSLTVLFAWTWGILIGALPFFISGQLNGLHSLFESVSGWTTTGLSVMDVTITPYIFLFHRSFMQYSGGLGFVLVMIMFISGKQSMSLYNAEGHPDKLMPNIKKTAQIIFVLYNSFLVLGIIAYLFTGMELFDAITHTMCALSTGGFSIKLNSIGEYQSLAINIVTIVLMFIGTTNFAVLLLFVKRKFSQALKVSEIKFMIIVFVIFVSVTTLVLMSSGSLSIWQSLDQASFGIASALSTSGFSTVNYALWPSLAIGILILMMLLGGGSGSTAGGIKMTRVYVLLRIVLLNIKKKMTPSREVDISYYIKAQGKTPIDNTLIIDTVGFIFSYLIIYIVGSFLITFTANTSLLDAMFEFASALGTVGLSVGITNASASSATLIIEIFGMILGRLEIFIVIIGVYSGFNIIKNSISRKLKWEK